MRAKGLSKLGHRRTVRTSSHLKQKSVLSLRSSTPLAKIARNSSNRTWSAVLRGKKGSNQHVLERLIGLETEYAAYYEPINDNDSAPSGSEIFRHLSKRLSWQLPVAPSHHSDRVFLANGGSISVESAIVGNGELSGLLEGATPECRSPSALVAHQIAQDEMFEEHLQSGPWQGKLRLLKNSADAAGHIYGVQENYEMEIAQGWRLFLFRSLMVALFPLVLLYWAAAGLWLGAIQLFCRGIWFCQRTSQSLRKRWAGRSEAVESRDRLVEETEPLVSTPEEADEELKEFPYSGIALRFAVTGLRVLHAPLAGLLTLILKATVLRQQRSKLSAFFATRVILDGAGHLDQGGRFWLGAKASVIDRWIGLGGYWGGRPVFVFGHWLKMLCTPQRNPWPLLKKMLQSRQRVQVALGDSAMSPASQYLRAGITSLVMDWLEHQGESEPAPRLVDAMDAMKSVARDEWLIAKFKDTKGKTWTALEVQRYYLVEVREFLQRSWQVPAEAWRIIRLWQDALDALQRSKHEEAGKKELLGKVDWASKRWMLQQVADDASWSVRKKVDLRFHELSEEGYYRKLTSAMGRPGLISREKIQQAKRLPPSDTPASKRGYLIREFSGCDAEVTAGWDYVRVVEDGKATLYDLTTANS